MKYIFEYFATNLVIELFFFFVGGIVRNASQAKPIYSKLGFRFGVYKIFVHLKKVLEVSLS